MVTRNDVKSAIKAFREGVSDGSWTQERAKMYLRLQDDPTVLMSEFRRICDEEPEIGQYVDNMV